MLGFVLLSDQEREKLAEYQRQINAMRDRQREQLDHLLKSWEVTSSRDPLAMVGRAIKRVYRDRP
jgi:hypothetical protein